MNARIGSGSSIHDGAIVGFVYREGCGPAVLGDGALVRSGTVIYGDVSAGVGLKCGHHALVREHTTLGDDVVVGTGVVIEGHCSLGSHIRIESGVFIPTHTTIGDHVFLGPRAVLTNDRYPLRRRLEYEPEGPLLEDDVTVGANATILPGVRIGAGSMIAAGAVVTQDVPAWSLVVGVPGRVTPLPPSLCEPNRPRSRIETDGRGRG